jgi:uncharacterized protein
MGRTMTLMIRTIAVAMCVGLCSDGALAQDDDRRVGDAEVTLPAFGEEEVTFASAAEPEEGADAVMLAGTLSTPVSGPDREAGFPAVVLVTGSGPQDRDQTIMGKKPFKHIADHMVNRGFVVLRYDDRGFGESTGDFASATVDDFTLDALGALEYLARRDDVDAECLFVIGHSEGGSVLAELLAQHADALTGGGVSLAGTAMPGSRVLTDQSVELARLQGVEGDDLEALRDAHRSLMQAMLDDADEETLIKRTIELVQLQAPQAGPEQALAIARQQVPAMRSVWMTRFLEHNPAKGFARAKAPVLAVFGGRDRQVTVDLNLVPMTRALERAGVPGSLVLVFPRKNHLFQTAKTGGLSEYMLLPEHIAPDVLEAVGDWLVEQAEAIDR